jgi:hypothetical protein
MAHHQPSVRALVASLLLSGCARGAYVAPDGPDTARLTVHNATGDVLPLDTFEDPEACSGRLALDRGGIPAGDVWTVRIAAGGPFTLTGRGAMGGVTYCTVAVTFTPASGQAYLAVYQLRGGKCSLQVGRRTSDKYAAKATYVVEPSVRQRDESACR